MGSACDNIALGEENIMNFKCPSSEMEYIYEKLPKNSTILDMGCGDGRHALYFAQKGFKVDAFDLCKRSIDKIRNNSHKDYVNCWVEDLKNFQFKKDYDLIIAHGLFQFVDKSTRDRIISDMKIHTNPGGYNVVAVFTDSVELPEEMKPYLVGVFKEGEIKNYYKDWTIKNYQTLKFEDCHKDNIKHKHSINKLIVRKSANLR